MWQLWGLGLLYLQSHYGKGNTYTTVRIKIMLQCTGHDSGCCQPGWCLVDRSKLFDGTSVTSPFKLISEREVWAPLGWSVLRKGCYKSKQLLRMFFFCLYIFFFCFSIHRWVLSPAVQMQITKDVGFVLPVLVAITCVDADFKALAGNYLSSFSSSSSSSSSFPSPPP